MKKGSFKKIVKGQTGNALILVLCFFLLGSLTLMPLLAHMGTMLKSGVSYENKSKEYYAADAGVEDGLYQIKYERLEALSHDPDFDYNYTGNCSYGIDGTINGFATTVTIQNCWLAAPDNPYPSAPAAKAVLERDLSDNTTNRIVVSETAVDTTNFRIKIDFYPAIDENDSLLVESLGIWIPHGFNYNHGCNLATFADSRNKYIETEDDDSPGGKTIVWDFSAAPLEFTDLPPVELDPEDDPQSAEITFNYTADVADTKPAAIAWIVTSGQIHNDIPMAWDIDTRYYKITSVAGDTRVEGYASRYDPRQVGAAFPGDYVAIGNSLLTGGSPRTTPVPEINSRIDLQSIPNGAGETDIADVTDAYLYWSGSYTDPYATPVWGLDSCGNFNNWSNTNPSTVWKVASVSSDNRFQGHFTTGTHVEAARYLELKNPIDLHTYTPGNVIIEWRQATAGSLESNDGITLQISSDNGTTWSSPPVTVFYDDVQSVESEAYKYYVLPQNPLPSLFKFRFRLESTMESGEYCYLDDIGVARITATADTAATFKIGAKSFNITADSYTIAAFEKYGEYAYACKYDATELVKANAENVTDSYGFVHYTGNAIYNVRDVGFDTGELRSYAGWSLIIIYSSPETAGHQLYLYDTIAFNSGYSDLDFDNDGIPGGTISGFKVPKQIGTDPYAAKLTCFVGEGDSAYDGDFIALNTPEALRTPSTLIPLANRLWDGIPLATNTAGNPYNVWNSKFVGSGTNDGIDIDTFNITWASQLIKEGDDKAYINLPSGIDNWMLIYMIFSVKSKTSVGGTAHYSITVD